MFLPYDRVFSDEGIKYTSADAYYNMRQVDNFAYNFPEHTEVDPYFTYPGATGEVNVRFFGWLTSFLSWIIGLGAPTEHTIDLVGVYLPAVFGALIVIPVYFIGKELFNRWVGLLSAGLIAILPGEFIGRSILGFSDYHVLEALLTTVTMMFLVLAVKTASRRQVTFENLKNLDWSIIRKPFIYSLLAGLFLGLYVLAWAGALLFVFIIFLYFVIQFIVDHLRKKSTEYLGIVGVPLFLVTLIITMVSFVDRLYIASVAIALIAPVVLGTLSWLMVKKRIKTGYYPLILFGLGLAGIGLFYLVAPSLFRSMMISLSNFIPRGAHITTIEMQPLISPAYQSSYGNIFAIVWGNYPGMIPLSTTGSGTDFQDILAFISTSFFLSLVSLCILIYLVFKQGAGEKIILVIWSLIILVLNLIQRRFGYYFAVNVALLVGYLAWRVLERGGFRETAAEKEEKPVEVRRRVRQKKGDSSVMARRAVMAIVLILVLVVVYPWNIEPATQVASQAQYAPSDAWVSSLKWMKENTPEPFGDPDSYYDIFELPPAEEDFEYPESAYGVLAWWDYGYWITRISHRLPTANPSQDPKVLTAIASFFTSQDEESADDIIREMGSEYIIVDYQTAYVNPVTMGSKFPAIATWAGEAMNKYFDLYLVPAEDGERWMLRPLFYPGYYNSMIVRLYNFNGEAVTPESVWVISYQESTDKAGNVFKQITGAEQFESYEAAEEYRSSQESPNVRIISPNPMISPVSLEALEHYELIHSSEGGIGLVDQTSVPEVKIFEYVE